MKCLFKSFFTAMQGFGGELLARDVTLRSPSPNEGAVLLDCGQVIQEILGISVSVDFVSFDIAQAVTGPLERHEERHRLWIRSDEKIADPRADDLTGGVVTVHPCHCIITFSQVCESEKTFDLFGIGKHDWNWLFQLKTPYPFRTVPDKSFISFLTFAHASYRPRALDGFPATVRDGGYQIDFFLGPMARRALVHGHSRRKTSVLFQRYAD